MQRSTKAGERAGRAAAGRCVDHREFDAAETAEVAGPREERLVDVARLLAARRGEGLRVEEGATPPTPDSERYANGAALPGPEGIDARLSGSGDVREHVDDRATRVFDEEAADAPRLVGERVDDSQLASDGLGVRGVDCGGFTDVDAEARLRVLHLLGANDELGRGVVWRLEVKHRIFHGHPHPENLDVEVARRGEFIPACVGDDPCHSHRRSVAELSALSACRHAEPLSHFSHLFRLALAFACH
jgi:hypothetical protein